MCLLVGLTGLALNTYLIRKTWKYNDEKGHFYTMDDTIFLYGLVYSCLGIAIGICGIVCFA